MLKHHITPLLNYVEILNLSLTYNKEINTKFYIIIISFDIKESELYLLILYKKGDKYLQCLLCYLGKINKYQKVDIVQESNRLKKETCMKESHGGQGFVDKSWNGTRGYKFMCASENQGKQQYACVPEILSQSYLPSFRHFTLSSNSF